MPLSTTWYYRPTHSAQYPSIPTRWDQHTRPRALGDPPPRQAPSQPVSRSLLARLARPTMSSRLRHDSPRNSFSYSHRYLTADDHYVWAKMDFLDDCYRCMYSRYGSVKQGRKL